MLNFDHWGTLIMIVSWRVEGGYSVNTNCSYPPIKLCLRRVVEQHGYRAPFNCARKLALHRRAGSVYCQLGIFFGFRSVLHSAVDCINTELLTNSAMACVTSATRCSTECLPPPNSASGSTRAASHRRHSSIRSQLGVLKLSNDIGLGKPSTRIASLKSLETK